MSRTTRTRPALTIGQSRRAFLWAQGLATGGGRLKGADVAGVVGLLAGVQYDPYPAVSQNHYLVLWNRIPGFAEADLDRAAYEERSVTESVALRRNTFFVRTSDLALMRAATRSVSRWGGSTAAQAERFEAQAGACEARDAVLATLEDTWPVTREGLWQAMGLSEDWERYREEARAGLSGTSPSAVPPASRQRFTAFALLLRRGDIVVSSRLPGTFRAPLYGPASRLLPAGARGEPEEPEAKRWLLALLLASYGVASASLLTFVSGLPGQEIRTLLAWAAQAGLAVEVEVQGLGRGGRTKAMWSSPEALGVAEAGPRTQPVEESGSGPGFSALLPPLDNALRHRPSIERLFGYGFEMEYSKKKGMRWPLSFLIGDSFAGWVDCAVNRRARTFHVRSYEMTGLGTESWAVLRTRVDDLARFHGAEAGEWEL